MRIEPLTCAIGAELLNVNLGDAVHDDSLFNEIYTALLKYKVLFLRDQNLERLSRKDHMAFAARMGELETHPMVPSHWVGCVRFRPKADLAQTPLIRLLRQHSRIDTRYKRD